MTMALESSPNTAAGFSVYSNAFTTASITREPESVWRLSENQSSGWEEESAWSPMARAANSGLSFRLHKLIHDRQREAYSARGGRRKRRFLLSSRIEESRIGNPHSPGDRWRTGSPIFQWRRTLPGPRCASIA